jgi:hypothetical protein
MRQGNKTKKFNRFLKEKNMQIIQKTEKYVQAYEIGDEVIQQSDLETIFFYPTKGNIADKIQKITILHLSIDKCSYTLSSGLVREEHTLIAKRDITPVLETMILDRTDLLYWDAEEALKEGLTRGNPRIMWEE